ncbi:MAG: hypothetical protein M4579_006873 [Chaenotheca gracillima]|nr:MAG: hypothetical protein M4579_006873 [Chaenotheca gracillima]
MNLGSATLRTVSVSRPDITQPPSRQSVAASDDYFSLDENASNASSHSETTVVRYETPLSQVRSPIASRESLHAENTVPSRPIAEDERQRRAPLERPAATSDPRAIAIAASTRETPVGEPSIASGRTTEAAASPPTPGLDDTPYIRYAIDQITRPESDLGMHRGDTDSSEEIYVSERLPPPGDPRHPRTPEPSGPSRDLDQAPKAPDTGVFISVEPPRESLRYPDLHYVPAILRPLALGVVTFLCLLMVAALIFCGVWSLRHQGLWDYDGADGSRYFVFGFLPQILSSILLLLILVVQTAATRVLPFASLAPKGSRGSKPRSGALLLDLFPTSFLFPDFSALRAGLPIFSVCFIIFWISFFAIPLQSAVFQVRLITVEGRGPTWRWAAVQPVLWALVAIYALVVAALLALVLLLVRRTTGLMWDPTSLADILCMLHRSNSLDDFGNIETLTRKRDYAEHVPNDHRLSYWKTHDEEQNIFYALGEEGASSNRSSRQMNEKVREQRSTGSLGATTPRGRETPTDHLYQTKIYSPSIRYQYIPWFLRDTFVIAWAVTAFVLLIAFLVVSFVNQAIKDGFRPLLLAAPEADGFSSAGFLYSFIPSLIGMILFLLWQSIDMHFRALQPFANMDNPEGASAENSLLLDYPSRLPVEITIKALAAGHYKVAWISFISLLSLAFPIIGGGVFWAISFPAMNEIRMVARMPAFYALTVLLAIYALSFIVIWPKKSRYLPHGICNLAEVISFVYRSPLLDDMAFRDPRSKTDLVTRLLGLAPGATTPSRYAFGIYQGRDRKEHLGIDRLHRAGAEMIIAPNETGKKP